MIISTSNPLHEILLRLNENIDSVVIEPIFIFKNETDSFNDKIRNLDYKENVVYMEKNNTTFLSYFCDILTSLKVELYISKMQTVDFYDLIRILNLKVEIL